MYRAAKRDANEAGIIEVLRSLDYSVQQLDDPGVPDLLVGKDQVNYLIEIKTENGKLTASQIEWINNWNGSVAVCNSIEQVMIVLGYPLEIWVY